VQGAARGVVGLYYFRNRYSDPTEFNDVVRELLAFDYHATWSQASR
jgi:hypothetical protein